MAFVCVRVCVFTCALASPPRAEQLWWAGKCAPPLGCGEEQSGELQGSSGPGGRPQHPQHGPAVPPAPGCQPRTQQPGGGEEAERVQAEITIYLKCSRVFVSKTFWYTTPSAQTLTFFLMFYHFHNKYTTWRFWGEEVKKIFHFGFFIKYKIQNPPHPSTFHPVPDGVNLHSHIVTTLDFTTFWHQWMNISNQGLLAW